LIDESKYRITADDAVQIFSILLESIIVMKEKGYSHTNLKPENIFFVHSKYAENQYILKLIDFEVLANREQGA
jgi:serine/threonine protein kinase